MNNNNNNNTSPTFSKSFPMNGGNGTCSYSKNSMYQREAAMIVKTMIDKVIAEKLDIQSLSITSNTFRIADLGCSVGPNTFISVQNLLEAVENKYQNSEKLPEFQVFFNDHSTNDFNTLFTSLPPEKDYFIAGVPGSFYGRIFPEASLHIVHSSYSLQWLSQVPQDVLDKDSPSWNKGKIFYTSSSDEVARAYEAQFSKDINDFLNARAKEIVVGGMMILTMPVAPYGVHRSQIASGWLYDSLGTTLTDMANEGLISEAQVDAINLPVYITSDKEMEELIQRNGFFSIEMVKAGELATTINEPIDMGILSVHIRAAVEGVIRKEIDSDEMMDEIFKRYAKKAEQYSQMDASYKQGTMLFLVLKRKS